MLEGTLGHSAIQDSWTQSTSGPGLSVKDLGEQVLVGRAKEQGESWEHVEAADKMRPDWGHIFVWAQVMVVQLRRWTHWMNMFSRHSPHLQGLVPVANICQHHLGKQPLLFPSALEETNVHAATAQGIPQMRAPGQMLEYLGGHRVENHTVHSKRSAAWKSGH